MAINIKIQPGNNSAGYSAIPLRLYADEVETELKFEYIINIATQKYVVDSAVSVAFNNYPATKLTFLEAHKLKLGQTIVIEDNLNNNYYSGYYNIIKIIDTNNIIINMTVGPLISAAMNLYSVDSRRFSPDVDGEAKIDLSNTLKNYVTQDLQDFNGIYAAPNTRMDYTLLLGKESVEVFKFSDNHFYSGEQLGFVANLPASFLNTTSFAVGDVIVIEQDMAEWSYTDNQFVSGWLSLIGTTKHDFRVGQEITITGQVTHPQYNGVTTIQSIVDDYQFVTFKSFDGSTPAEPGVALGIPRPEYNTSATITKIVYEPLYGIIIITDQPFTDSTEAIGGVIRPAGDEKSVKLLEKKISNLSAYNARIKTEDFKFSTQNFNPYVCQLRAANLNNISTILGNDYKYRIQKDSKSWLLAHSKGLGDVNQLDVLYKFYSANGMLISTTLMTNVEKLEDFHFPVGIDQIVASPNLTTVNGASIASVADSVTEYTVVMRRASAEYSNTIKFRLNDDCAGYDVYNVLWKDRLGSWLSYPFVYKSEEGTEFERKTYYQSEGTWKDDDTFGYESFDSGEKTYFARNRDKFNVSSGWIDEQENELIKDMISSASQYVQRPDGKLIAVNIINKDVFKGDSKVNPLWNYTIQMNASNNELRY